METCYNLFPKPMSFKGMSVFNGTVPSGTISGQLQKNKYENRYKSLTIERGENVLLKCIDDKLEEQIKQNAEFEGKVPR